MPSNKFDITIRSFGTTNTVNLVDAKNDLEVMVSISKATRTNARIKVIIDYPWSFKDPSKVTTAKLEVSADNELPKESLVVPTITKIEKIYDNEFDVILSSALAVGQIFILKIPEIVNPGFKSTGGIYMYLMETNSNSYIAGYNNDGYLKTNQYVINIAMTHPTGLPMT